MHRILLVCGITACLFAFVILGIGAVLIKPATRAIGAAPTDLDAQIIVLSLSPTDSISGWFVKGQVGGGAVLLLHGVWGDRRAMVERARFLSH
ncbi:MAG: hypothetical protein PHU14_08015, partial [Methylovulum sp.]|nr:hypothetical protein [Methylovulum sp.]